MDVRELKRRLRAIREPAPPPELRDRLERGIPDSPRQPESAWWPERSWTMAKIGAVTVSAAAIGAAGWIAATLFLGPGGTTTAYAAALEPVAQATARTNAVHVILRMLTREGEDFTFVNLGGELQPVEAWVDSGRARMDKPDRITVFDGKETVFYHPSRREAFRSAGSGIDTDLFWPAAWVREIQSRPGGEVEVLSRDTSGGRGRILLREKAAPGRRLAPSFLGDFDRETEVVWDLETQRLLGLRRWVYTGDQRRLFSELLSVEYLDAIPDERFRLELPADVRWGGISEAPAVFASLGPREIAARLFDAAVKGDRKTLEILCPSPATVDFLLDAKTRPSELLFLGEPFRSGEYPGVYVPYKVRYGPQGSVRAHNLALRDDNPALRWVYDGGI
jgi:hypothetical protein